MFGATFRLAGETAAYVVTATTVWHFVICGVFDIYSYSLLFDSQVIHQPSGIGGKADFSMVASC